MRKPAFCICENKDADQLYGNRTADQCLCFHYTDSTIPLLPKSEISRLYLSSVAPQAGLCWTWSETPKTGFLVSGSFLYSVAKLENYQLANTEISHHTWKNRFKQVAQRAMIAHLRTSIFK